MYQENELIIGEVYKIKPFGLFLKFEDGKEGLLHISELSDSYIKDIENFGSIGDKIKVKILSVDEANGFLRLSFKAVPAEERYTTHSNSNRKAPEVAEADFKTLADNLPKWIEETLKKANGEIDNEITIEQSDD